MTWLIPDAPLIAMAAARIADFRNAPTVALMPEPLNDAFALPAIAAGLAVAASAHDGFVMPRRLSTPFARAA